MQRYLVSKRGIETYNPEKHLKEVWDFIFWEGTEKNESMLLAGDGCYNGKAIFISSFINISFLNRELPDGAGICLRNYNLMVIWDITFFKTETPKNLRPIIMDALGL